MTSFDPSRRYSWDDPKDPRSTEVVAELPDISFYDGLRAITLEGQSEDVDGLLAVADAHERLAQFEPALSIVEEVLLDHGDPTVSAEAQLRAARLECRLGDANASDARLKQLAAEASTRSDPKVASLALTGLATLQLAHADIGTTVDYLDRAFRLARETHFTVGKGHALATVGLALARVAVGYQVRERHEACQRARDILGRAALLHQRAASVESLGYVYNNIGITYVLEEKYENAIPYLERGLDFLSDRGDLVALLNALNNNMWALEWPRLVGPAHQFRDPMREYVDLLPDPPPGRTQDGAIWPLHMALPRRTAASFREEPFVTDFVVFAPVPSGV